MEHSQNTGRMRILARHISPEPCAAIYSAVEWDARCQLAAAYRIARYMDWDQHIYNHITLRVDGSELVPGGPHFLINPFGLRFDEVTASNLLKVDLEGNVIDPGTGAGPLFKQGFVVHLSLIHI
eukprot:TRINITY_DN10766_c0_g1_i1.p2 TRINITY_DN10766_c0_g1~~TRINITY_DN10766_c0_g1_i1.p2  ORF type:complete len:124 (+),score=15.71 TRINITY_DN10766_c0_g1_i1:125-496(+)